MTSEAETSSMLKTSVKFEVLLLNSGSAPGCNYSPSFEKFSVLTRESNDFKLKIMESPLIARDKPILILTRQISLYV